MTINYPSLAFAFNPVIIEVSQATGGTVSVKAKNHTITRAIIEGSAKVDIQALLQAVFNRRIFHFVYDRDHQLWDRVYVEVTDGSGTQGVFIETIWGALQFGETYTQDKTLTYFKGLPFTVPLLITGANKMIRIKIDGGEFTNYGSRSAGKYNLSLPSEANDVIYLRVEGLPGESADFFDYTFDYTFRAIERDSAFIKINVRDCTKGIYLRWINKHGEYCYYLFEDGTSSNAIQNGGVNLNEFVRTLEFQNGYSAGSNRPSEKNAQKSVRLFAPLVDKSTFDMLEGLPESLVVDLFMGLDQDGNGKWMGVNISPGTFTRTTASLQDFECNMLYPITFNQSL